MDKKIEKARINAYVAKGLKDRLQEYCDEMGINMSAGLAVILKTYFDQQDVVTMAQKFKEMENK